MIKDLDLFLLQYVVDEADVVVDAKDKHAAPLIQASEHLVDPSLAERFVFRDRLILVLRLVKTFAHSIQCDQVIDRWMTFPSQKIWYVTYCYVDSPVCYVLPHDFSITPLFGSD